jgi:hypothetical protein
MDSESEGVAMLLCEEASSFPPYSFVRSPTCSLKEDTCALSDCSPGLRPNVTMKDFSTLVSRLHDSSHDKFGKALIAIWKTGETGD